MVTNATQTSFIVDGQLIDLTALYTKVQLLGNGATIHTARSLYCKLMFIPMAIERKYDYAPDDAKILSWYSELQTILKGVQ